MPLNLEFKLSESTQISGQQFHISAYIITKCQHTLTVPKRCWSRCQFLWQSGNEGYPLSIVKGKRPHYTAHTAQLAHTHTRTHTHTHTLTVPDAVAARAFPTDVEPVKPILRTSLLLASSWPASVQTRLWCARLGIKHRNRNNEIDDTSTSLASSWPASVKQKYGVQD